MKNAFVNIELDYVELTEEGLEDWEQERKITVTFRK